MKISSIDIQLRSCQTICELGLAGRQVQDRTISIARTASILLLFILLSITVGLGVNAILTEMYPILNQSGSEISSADICSAWACSRYLLGQLGWVNLAYLLTFVPLAMFTGLVTQFIFEERTVTATIWVPDE